MAWNFICFFHVLRHGIVACTDFNSTKKCIKVITNNRNVLKKNNNVQKLLNF